MHIGWLIAAAFLALFGAWAFFRARHVQRAGLDIFDNGDQPSGLARQLVAEFHGSGFYLFAARAIGLAVMAGAAYCAYRGFA